MYTISVLVTGSNILVGGITDTIDACELKNNQFTCVTLDSKIENYRNMIMSLVGDDFENC